MKCNLFPENIKTSNYCHADTECFLQLKILKSKTQAASSTGLRVARYISGERIHLVEYFPLANTLPFSPHILGL